ncbi:MAG: hypothetical protein C4532_14480 [Candidatus Abyssobacteria bacterium SURF_17]|uniref:Uncharacterized protein n=1 Tax=Candidatus Abyssobacteria bacterium SURF_17 TaxID=2093361 RepID=A0A419EU30_9BACT|nr:MAG: hypothetical protein C4532_14480 [Candidatus Abyssubacteria bacterium SURF_17]
MRRQWLGPYFPALKDRDRTGAIADLKSRAIWKLLVVLTGKLVMLLFDSTDNCKFRSNFGLLG